MSESKKPKVLVVSIACEPKGGSEGKVGWEAILAISKFAEVHVLMSALWRKGWEEAESEGLVPEGVSAGFVGTDADWHPNRLIARGQSWLRYLEFLKLAKPYIKDYLEHHQVDVLHQVTFATWRVPTELWVFGKPVVWGPIGGAGEVPKAFRSSLSRAARIVEVVRSWQGKRTLRSKKFRSAMEQVEVVIAASEEAKQLLEPYRKGKFLEVLPVAYLSGDKVAQIRRIRSNDDPDDRPGITRTLNIFAGGSIDGRKGIAWALRALVLVKEKGIDFHYTIAGGGPELESLKALVVELGLSEQVTFHPGYRGDQYVEMLQQTDIFLLPSFRETLGMTCQEAILAGAYPVVADISAHGEMARVAGVERAPVGSGEELKEGIAELILDFVNHPVENRRFVDRASEAIEEFFSERRYRRSLETWYQVAIEKATGARSSS